MCVCVKGSFSFQQASFWLCHNFVYLNQIQCLSILNKSNDLFVWLVFCLFLRWNWFHFSMVFCLQSQTQTFIEKCKRQLSFFVISALLLKHMLSCFFLPLSSETCPVICHFSNCNIQHLLHQKCFYSPSLLIHHSTFAYELVLNSFSQPFLLWGSLCWWKLCWAQQQMFLDTLCS